MLLSMWGTFRSPGLTAAPLRLCTPGMRTFPEATVLAQTKTFLAARGLSLDPGPLAAYACLLLGWNAKTNLVGARDPATLLDDLVADSIPLAELLGRLALPESPKTLDLGSGAGIPAIPLRLLWSKGGMTLVERREKRAAFLRLAVRKAGLTGVEVFQGEAKEALKRAAPVDCVISRAFMPPKRLLDFVAPHLALGGFVVFLAPKTETAHPDFETAGDVAYAAGDKSRIVWAVTRRESPLVR